jgi:hypothetical protein
MIAVHLFLVFAVPNRVFMSSDYSLLVFPSSKAEAQG